MTTHLDDQAIQALSDEGAMCGDCGDQPGDRTCPECERHRRRYVAALRKAGWIPAGELQHQLDQCQSELAAIKRDLAAFTAAVSAGRGTR